MVTVECIESEKSEGQTNIQTNKQTREPLGKGESRTGSNTGWKSNVSGYYFADNVGGTTI